MVAFTLTDVDRDDDGGGSSGFSVSIGSGGSERTILFAIFTVGVTTAPTLIQLTSVNEDSGGATGIALLQQGTNPVGVANNTAWFAMRAADLIDPNDTTISITVTPTASVLRCNIAVFVTADPVNIDTVYDTAVDSSDSEDPTVFNLSVDVPNAGAVLCAAGLNCSVSAGATFAWTGLPDPGEVEDSSSANVVFSVSHDGDMAESTGFAISVDINATGESIGEAACISLAPGQSVAVAAAAGVGTATAVGQSTITATGLASGIGAALAVGQSSVTADAFSAGVGTAVAVDAGSTSPAAAGDDGGLWAYMQRRRMLN